MGRTRGQHPDRLGYPLSYLLAKPDKPDDSRSIRHKVGICCRRVLVADPTMLFTNPTTRVVRRRVAVSGYEGGSTNPTLLVASKIAKVRGSLLCASGSSGRLKG